MGLTKEQAIEEHRKMWRWIAEELESHTVEELCKKYFGLSAMKAEYLIKNDKTIVLNCCFCCEYAAQVVGAVIEICKECPIKWPGTGDKWGLYQCDVDCGVYRLAWGCFKRMHSCYINRDSIGRAERAIEEKEECIKLCKQIAELPEA